jgi:hypothetical protein
MGHWNFSLTYFFRLHYGPGVNHACNRNEYQEYFIWNKGSQCIGLPTLPPSCADCLKVWETSSWKCRASGLYRDCFTSCFIPFMWCFEHHTVWWVYLTSVIKGVKKFEMHMCIYIFISVYTTCVWGNAKRLDVVVTLLCSVWSYYFCSVHSIMYCVTSHSRFFTFRACCRFIVTWHQSEIEWMKMLSHTYSFFPLYILDCVFKYIAKYTH